MDRRGFLGSLVALAVAPLAGVLNVRPKRAAASVAAWDGRVIYPDPGQFQARSFIGHRYRMPMGTGYSDELPLSRRVGV